METVKGLLLRLVQSLWALQVCKCCGLQANASEEISPLFLAAGWGGRYLEVKREKPVWSFCSFFSWFYSKCFWELRISANCDQRMAKRWWESIRFEDGCSQSCFKRFSVEHLAVFSSSVRMKPFTADALSRISTCRLFSIILVQVRLIMRLHYC